MEKMIRTRAVKPMLIAAAMMKALMMLDMFFLLSITLLYHHKRIKLENTLTFQVLTTIGAHTPNPLKSLHFSGAQHLSRKIFPHLLKCLSSFHTAEIEKTQ